MNDYIREITLDLNCERSCQTIMLTQFDKGKKIHLTVKANGAPYSVSGCSVVMKGVNSDGSRVAIDCDIEPDGTATAVTDDITFAVKGFAAARFVISDSQRTYNTQRFLIYVDDALDTDVTSDPAYSILNRLIREVQLIDEHGGIIVDDELSGASTHPVQNRVVNAALSTKAPASTAYTFDSTTATVTYNANNPKIIYLNATVDGENGIVLTSANNDCQYFFGSSKSVKIRNKNGTNTYTDWEPASEKAANKKSSITSSNKTSADFYPSIKAVVDYLASNYENLSNKLTSEDGIDEDSTDTQYPSAKAVYDFGGEIVDLVNEDISDVESSLADLKTYIGYTSGDILGLQADFENKRFTRLGAAVGKTAGSDFDTDAFPMYKNRRKCNVADDGTINAFYGDAGYTDDGSNGQVMVYQPKFYYKTVPLKLERADTGLGCNIRKANYYITATPRPGFRLHPVFHDSNGNEVEYVLFSAYEGSAYAPSLERIIDENTDTLSYSEGMKLCSVANVKPISGKLTGFGSRNNLEVMANARGAGWHIDTVQAIAANQLLMLIETGRFELQSVIGKGVVSLISSAITGAAASFGNGTGEASVTYAVIGGTAYSEGGKRSVCYRGLENPWGSLCEHVNGINVWGNGSMYGGQVYIAGDFDFSDNRHTGNYHAAGFLLPNNIQASLGFNKYISSFGYSSEDFDWLFIPTEGNGNNAAPVGDTFYGSQDLNGKRTACYGGRSYEGLGCGCAHWSFGQYVGTRNEGFGGRLFYVPTATA